MNTLFGSNRHTRELISVTQTQQPRPESPTVTLTWHASKYEVHELHLRYILRSLLFVFVLRISSAN